MKPVFYVIISEVAVRFQVADKKFLFMPACLGYVFFVREAGVDMGVTGEVFQEVAVGKLKIKPVKFFSYFVFCSSLVPAGKLSSGR